MRRQVLFLALGALALLAGTSAKAHAWGCAHVGYTHVGPNGVYHAGATEARGPGGAYGGYHEGGAAYGGGYREGYGGAAYGGAAGGYHYDTRYYGGGAVGGASYGYVR